MSDTLKLCQRCEEMAHIKPHYKLCDHCEMEVLQIAHHNEMILKSEQESAA